MGIRVASIFLRLAAATALVLATDTIGEACLTHLVELALRPLPAPWAFLAPSVALTLLLVSSVFACYSVGLLSSDTLMQLMPAPSSALCVAYIAGFSLPMTALLVEVPFGHYVFAIPDDLIRNFASLALNFYDPSLRSSSFGLPSWAPLLGLFVQLQQRCCCRLFAFHSHITCSHGQNHS